ncbi:MAG: hypothetical protein PVH89_10285 [Gammaproteobacteria bacterium]|jgi:hypothetical protein
MRGLAMRGISLLEFALVVAAIAVVSGLLLGRVLDLIGQSERAAFLHTTRLIQSALLLEAAERVARGESASLSELADSNPMQLLLEPPGNYVGTLDAGGSGPLLRRSWHFDAEDHHLVYRPGRQARFDAEEGPSDRIEMRVRFAFEDRDNDGRFDASVDHFDGLRFESVYPYSWPK